MTVIFRAARPAEATLLGEIALRSKAYWGYDKDFMEACRAELTFAPQDVLDRRIVVAERQSKILGFYSIDGDPPEGELGNMWLDPANIGTGLGRKLWHHATQTAQAAGFKQLTIDAEPYAEGFYLAMGAERIGETPSGSVPGRVLPLMKVQLDIIRIEP
ncbi:GNAT superfamily N-acetyltransferase [Kibdelosporangium banguiense]|uniref:GNAT superfamily N-acetyltransferase n=1 Tax=Kibdelosporangium banguiense TaxID=1365924 RepID=A0ABS4TKZ3_9PSEU|nr:GNAT family N-acetyltransferase [Kibdelosporangium banguiense]MBP2325077.1 GNAT superfamily N-acetyltransferase [Kibdelosporangium banguiense]